MSCDLCGKKRTMLRVRASTSRFCKGCAHRRPIADRFWEKVLIGGEHECWPWMAARHTHGYGAFGVGKRTYNAHRIAHELSTGLPAGDLFVCHRCDNPVCCNPGHLFLGTPADNVHDMLSKYRRHMITPEVAVEIRRASEAGIWTRRELGEVFGFSPSTIWKHLRNA